jgi:hypothetical protein
MDNTVYSMDDRGKETVSTTPVSELIRKPNGNNVPLTEKQILELKNKYNLTYMTCEEEETLLQDLKKMGVLSKGECGTFLSSSGNILEELTRQFSSDINQLYRMSIAGKYSILHIENLQREQKIINVLEQLAEY